MIAAVSRPKRLPNRSYTGLAQYFLTFCVIERRPAFKEAAVVQETLAQFQRPAAEERFEIRAYCFMPDHVHLLAMGVAADSDLRRFVKTAKERSGRAYRKRAGKRLWQEGYFERVLRDEAEARKCARYVVLNPVRAGLVRAPTDYPHVGSTGWTIDDLARALDQQGASEMLGRSPA